MLSRRGDRARVFEAGISRIAEPERIKGVQTVFEVPPVQQRTRRVALELAPNPDYGLPHLILQEFLRELVSRRQEHAKRQTP